MLLSSVEVTAPCSVGYGFIGLLSPYVEPPKAFEIGSSIPLKRLTVRQRHYDLAVQLADEGFDGWSHENAEHLGEMLHSCLPIG